MAMVVAEFSHFLSCVKTFDVTHSWQDWRDISFSSSSISSQKCACVQSKVIFCDKPCKNIYRDQRFCHGILVFGTKETFQMQVCDADCDWESVILHHMQYWYSHTFANTPSPCKKQTITMDDRRRQRTDARKIFNLQLHNDKQNLYQPCGDIFYFQLTWPAPVGALLNTKEATWS